MIGAFGKIPAKPDFIRVGHSDATTRGFEPWLDESHLRLREADVAFPTGPVKLVFHPPGAASACVCVLGASTDAVGRRFPLSLFQLLPWPNVQGRWSGLPVASNAFVEAAEQVLADSATLDLAGLQSRVGALPAMGAVELEGADAICRNVLDGSGWIEVAERLFPSGTQDRVAYALHTLILASRRSATVNVALDGPVVVDVDLFFWLELVRRFTQSDGVAYAWVEEPAPRLVVALGAPSTSLLLALAAPTCEWPQVWPLDTTRPHALAAADTAMAPILAPIREGNVSMEELLQRLEQVGNG